MKGFRIFRIFGIDIEIHWTWIFIFLFLASSLSRGFLPREVPNQPMLHYWFFGIIITILLFASLLFHELSHSLMAKRFGLSVKKITLFILGGVAHLEEDPKNAKSEFLMSAAGPVSSFFLAGLFRFFYASGANFLPPMVAAIFHYLSLINILLAVFNLLPGFPLDGGRIFKAILWWFQKDELKAIRIAAKGGEILGIIMMGGGLFLAIFYRDIGSLMLVFIGLFLFTVARGYSGCSPSE